MSGASTPGEGLKLTTRGRVRLQFTTVMVSGLGFKLS